MTSSYSSYRDLLVAKNEGEQIKTYQLDCWRREEEFLRSATANVRAFRSCGLEEKHFEAMMHRCAWRALLDIDKKAESESEVDQSVLLSAMRLHEPDLTAGLKGSNWVAALYREPPIPIDWAYRVMVPELKQRWSLKIWGKKMRMAGQRAKVETDYPSLAEDFANLASDFLIDHNTSGRRFSGSMVDYQPPDGGFDILRTGNAPLDHAIGGGFATSELTVIGGGTGHGKSYLALDIHQRLAVRGTPGLYISVEDPEELIHCRILSEYCGASPNEIREYYDCVRKGLPTRISPKAIEEAKKLWRESTGSRDHVHYVSKGTVRTVCDIIRAHKYSKGIKFAIVDYLQVIRVDDVGGQMQKTQQMSVVVDMLRELTVDIGISMIALSQYARDEYSNGAEPTLQSFKYCGDIENECQNGICLWRDSEGRLIGKVAKTKWVGHRTTPKFHIPVKDNGWHGEWEDMWDEASGVKEEASRRAKRLPK